MSYSKVSVLLPTRNRIEYLKRMLKSYEETLVDPAQSEFVFRVDFDDLESARFLAPYGWPFIVGPRKEGYKSLPGFYNEMVRLATGDLFICGNDDMLFQTRDWPRLVIEEANKYPDGIFNIGVSTGLNDDKFPFSIVSHQLIERLGKINDERLLFSDVFLLDVAQHFGRAIRMRNVVFHHDWAGHTDDQTRREANKHEFDQVFANVHGDWSDEYRERHQRVVNEAIEKIDPSADFRTTLALEEFRRFEPTAPRNPYWPPQASMTAWGIRGGGGIHYGLEETRSMLNALLQSGVRRKRAVITHYQNGLPSVLWGTLFDHVTTIRQQPKLDTPFVEGKHTIEFGSIDNTKFMYDVINRVGEPNLLVLDGARYSELISPYYLFREVLSRPGMIIFASAAGDDALGPGVPRFIADLRSGAIDGVHHDIVDVIPRDGAGLSYELVK